MIRYQGGSLDAFQEIYAQLAPGVRRYLRHLAFGSETADDLLQEVWLDVFRGIARLADPGALTPWLYRIARHRALRDR